MTDWGAVLKLLLWASALISIVGIIALPLVLARMPADYFVRATPPPDSIKVQHPVVRLLIAMVRNSIALVFLILGVILLFTPGQGVLLLLVALMLGEFPGKRAWERRLVSAPGVEKAINKIRAYAGRPPLILTADHDPPVE